ncbi:ExbD/TolR family protein [Thiobacter aerophilum]|uniref:Biopolymer transporter ExbD n=1 Tax=Thiobacter aerophilum TaxID=3121275 RepID=A0ABV0EH16_9BURK
MDFRRGRERENVEINLIPMIDVLLVIVIFLAVTTTFSQIAQLQITLPTAEAEKPVQQPAPINVAVDAQGRYLVNGKPFVGKGPEALSVALKQAAGDQSDPMIVISADAQATHQSVINVMEAARLAGFARLTFATQAGRH